MLHGTNPLAYCATGVTDVDKSFVTTKPKKGNTTLTITTHIIMTLSITTLSITKHSITTLSITTHSIMTLSIKTLIITTHSITTLSTMTINTMC